MSLNDPVANILSQLDNAVKVGKNQIVLKQSSTIIKKILAIMHENGYVGSIEEQADIKGDYLLVNLVGKLNRCGVVKPRFPIKLDDFEKFEKRYLPARGFGILIVSTSKGLMTHEEAKAKEIGGRLISYCY